MAEDLSDASDDFPEDQGVEDASNQQHQLGAPAEEAGRLIEPKMGGTLHRPDGRVIVWTGGVPLADWSGLKEPDPRHVMPGQFRLTSVNSALKSQFYRTQGLRQKISRKPDADLLLSQRRVFEHLKTYGMQAITYLPDPSCRDTTIEKTRMISVVTHHTRFNLISAQNAELVQKGEYDEYDYENIEDAKKFLRNSLEPSLEIQLYENCPEEESFIVHWMHLTQLLGDFSIDRFDRIRDALKKRLPTDYPGEDIEKLCSDYLADWQKLDRSGMYDHKLTLNMLDTILSAGDETFRYELRGIRIKLREALDRTRHMAPADVQRELAQEQLDVQNILTKSKLTYASLKAEGKWPAIMNSRPARGVPRAFQARRQYVTPMANRLELAGRGSQRTERSRSDDRCFNCGQTGHWSRNCPQPPSANRSNQTSIDQRSRHPNRHRNRARPPSSNHQSRPRGNSSRNNGGHQARPSPSANAAEARVELDLHPAAFMATAYPTVHPGDPCSPPSLSSDHDSASYRLTTLTLIVGAIGLRQCAPGSLVDLVVMATLALVMLVHRNELEPFLVRRIQPVNRHPTREYRQLMATISQLKAELITEIRRTCRGPRAPPPRGYHRQSAWPSRRPQAQAWATPGLRERINLHGRRILFDSGANCAISNDLNDFPDGAEGSHSSPRVDGLSQGLKVEGSGTIEWTFRADDGTTRTICVPGLYVPSSQTCLLGTSVLLRTYPEESITITEDSLTLSGSAQEPPVTIDICRRTELPFGTLASRIPVSAYTASVSDGDTPQALPSLTARTNFNLSDPEKELLRWHYRLGHVNMQRVQWMFRQGFLRTGERSRSLQAAAARLAKGPLCTACQYAKQRRRSTPGTVISSVPEQQGSLTANRLYPGQEVSVDHFHSNPRGRLLTSYGKETTDRKYMGGCVFVDHATGFIHVVLQSSTNSHMTLQAKREFEALCADHGVVVAEYLSDNGTAFRNEEFTRHLSEFRQVTRYAAVGAHHSNGLAEVTISKILSISRAMLHHSAIHWPEMADPELWPCAVLHAVYLLNRLPRVDTGQSPYELFTQSRWPRSNLLLFHVWGCPVYVLNSTLSDGKKLPRWKPRSAIHQHMGSGTSTRHSHSIPLVLNPDTGKITAQYHVVFDDWFHTVHTNDADVPNFDSDAWYHTFGLTEWQYVPSDALPVSTVEPPANPYLTHQQRLREARDAADPPITPPSEELSSHGEALPTPVTPPQEEEGALDARTASPEEVNITPDLTTASPATDLSSIGTDGMISSPEEAPSDDPVLAPEEASSADASPVPDDASTQEASAPAQTAAAVRPHLKRESAVTPVRRSTRLQAKRGNPYLGPITRSRAKGFMANSLSHLYQHTSPCLPGLRSKVTQEIMDPLLAFWAASALPSSALPSPLSSIGHSYLASKSDPDTFNWEQAMASDLRDDWLIAASNEIKELEAHGTWEVDLKSNATTPIISTLWVFKIKRDPSGAVKKYKGRLTVRGDQQNYIGETYSPVASWSTIRAFLMISTILNMTTATVDYSNAFVQAPMPDSTPTWIHVPRGFRLTEGSDHCLKLVKSLYGTANAPLLWFNHLSKHLLALGFHQSKLDPCLWYSKRVTVIIYVDDLAVAARTSEDIDEFVRRSESMGFTLKQEDSFSEFLGIKFEHKPDGRVIMTQQSLIAKVLATADMTECNPRATPADSTALGKDENGSAMKEKWNYRAIIGMLLYLSTNTRPDIAYAVSQAARFSQNPRQSHALAVKAILRYLKGTSDKGTIVCTKGNSTLELQMFVDADFAGLYGREDDHDPNSVRSRTGYIIKLGPWPLIWKSQLQTHISQSTLEAEYSALSTSLRVFLPIRDIVEELLAEFQQQPLAEIRVQAAVFEDNQGAYYLATNQRITNRTKYFLVKWHWFWDKYNQGLFKVNKCESKDQQADWLTKGLVRDKFEDNRKKVIGW